MSTSLFVIHESLQNLENLRAELLAQEPLDTAAIASTEAAIFEWLTADAHKVTSYVGLIQKRGFDAVAAKSMKEYWARIEKQADADVERLKANSLAVMQLFDVKELKATPGGGLRRQGNGGVEPLVIHDWPVDASGNFKPVPHTLGDKHWIPVKYMVVPDTKTIREVLQRRVTCKACQFISGNEAGPAPRKDCEMCKGVGTIPEIIPGCKLMERGEHVRVI